jgi:NADH:ubiquinone oxidoreductase subunit 5 (subunit L)/multisubunit Na+/H+ antiporter MnhA subunit
MLSIIGCPFLDGFYLKDLFIEFLYIYELNRFLILIMLISLSLTVTYSLRLYYLFFIKNLRFISVEALNENRLMYV